jgi:agmatine deiminase
MPLKQDSMAPAAAGFGMPAEWDAHLRTWMAWPARLETWGSPDALQAARVAHVEVARAIAAFEPVRMACGLGDVAEASLMCGPGIEIVPVPLSDGWMRDIGPTFVRNGTSKEIAGVDWLFNGWGGLHQDWSLDAGVAAAVVELNGQQRFQAPFVLEGGAIHVDGEGTALVTEECLLDPRRNPDIDKRTVERYLADWLGVDSVIWLGRGYDGDETVGHIDEVAAFARPGTVLLHATHDVGDANSAIAADNLNRLHAARDARGRQLEVIELPQPPRRDEAGRRLTQSYANFYFTNGGLILPAFEASTDGEAFKLFRKLFPEREIVQVLATDLVRGGGGIHCITQQEPV